MPTLYIDYENGNDNYGGTSFALKASGSDGAITSTTFSSASASFPNDGSLINQYLSIFNGTIYAVYQITAWVSSTSLTIAALSGGTALANQTARQYYIGGRWQTLAAATAVRTVPGDVIRLMASTAPTSIGNATWTGPSRPASISISSSTNATPIVITTSTAHGFVTGDYVSVAAHLTNTNATGIWKVGTVPTSTSFQILQINGSNTTGNGVGSGGNVTKINNVMIKTATPLVQNIALQGGLGQKIAWTPSANVNCSVSGSQFKEGNGSMFFDVTATFTTGLAAYYTLPSTLDLSAYQQVSFWVRQSAGTLGAVGSVYLALCTDTVGAVVAHTCNIPTMGALSTWQPVTIDFATNLNAAIRSVAFYVATDNGAQQFFLDDIIACKASSDAASITLRSLISKSDGTGNEVWCSVQSINYDAIMIGNGINTNALSATIRGYSGTSETVTTYKLEPTRAIASTTVTIAEGDVEYSGGWNRTDMSTQTGETWLDFRNGQGSVTQGGTWSNLTWSKINITRSDSGFNAGNTINLSVPSYRATGNTTTGFNTNGLLTPVIGSLWANNNNGSGVTNGGTAPTGLKATAMYVVSNSGPGCATLGNWANITTLVTSNNGGDGYQSGSDCYGTRILSLTTLNNTNYGLLMGSAAGLTGDGLYVLGGTSSGNTSGFCSLRGVLTLDNFVVSDSVEFNTAFAPGIAYSNNHDGTVGNNRLFMQRGSVNQQNSVVDSPATTSWRMSPTATSATANYPVMLKLGTVVCAASSLVTVTARMQRDNTGLTMRLCCPGSQINGVDSDVTADMTAAANTWETVTITFTPTAAGAVEIYAYAFGGTTYNGYVCNLTASQA